MRGERGIGFGRGCLQCFVYHSMVNEGWTLQVVTKLTASYQNECADSSCPRCFFDSSPNSNRIESLTNLSVKSRKSYWEYRNFLRLYWFYVAVLELMRGEILTYLELHYFYGSLCVKLPKSRWSQKAFLRSLLWIQYINCPTIFWRR